MDARRKDWVELSAGQRNCLEWPDFLQWDVTRDVEIHRRSPKDSIGLITTVMQDPETKNCYHIAKRIKENHPAHGIVNSFEWVCAVDGKPTTERREIKHLIQNGNNSVRLSLKTVVDPLSTVKTWTMAEKVVVVDIKEKKCGFELVHFYCKEENGNVKDRILIWDVNPPPQSSLQLFRGDELLAVNDVAVEGKQLAQIYNLIFTKIPFKVELKMKKIQRDTKVLMPQQETDNRGPSRNWWQSLKKKKAVRQSSRSENHGYVETPKGTPEAFRKTNPNTTDPSASTDKMCITCIKKRETSLPDDRNKWPISKIAIACYAEMCTLLDLDDWSKVKLLAALECFDQTEASSINQKFKGTGGEGIAKHALGKWGNRDRTHNVGALKEIVKDKMKRQDVIDEIEKWEKLNVCHGCGIKLKENN